MSTSEDLGTGNITQNQEQPVMPGTPNADAPVPRDQRPGDAHLQDFPGNFQGRGSLMSAPLTCVTFPPKSLEADRVAEIGLEELNGLEKEVMRKQMQVISGRLHALEDWDVIWCHKEAVLCSLLVSLS